jgi:hypothetical protein
MDNGKPAMAGKSRRARGLEDVQYLAEHASPTATRVYDHRRWKVTRHIVERISI